MPKSPPLLGRLWWQRRDRPDGPAVEADADGDRDAPRSHDASSGSSLEDAKHAALLTTMAAAASPPPSAKEQKTGDPPAPPPPEAPAGNLADDPHLRHGGKDPQSYHWRSTLKGSLDDVGQLTVHVVGANGLYGADFGGKSDPFCTVSLGDLEFRSEIWSRTVDPEWNERFHFPVVDMSEAVHVSVYDHDRFHEPELLGRVTVPLLGIHAGREEEDSHGERVFALKDKKCDKRAKGKHPRIRLKFELDWNLPRACFKTIRSPMKKEPPGFKKSLLIGNVQRVRKILHFASSSNQYMQSCFNWEKPSRSIRAFLAYELFVYLCEPFVLPFCLMAAMLFIYPLYSSYIVNDWLDPYYELVVVDDEDDEREDEKADKKSGGGVLRVKAIQEVTVFVQNTLGRLASTVERAKNVFTFAEPFMSWIAVAFLAVATVVLYCVPLRTLFMIYGVHKFSKKLLRPNHIPSSEILNFLSRVPDDPELDRRKTLSVMDEELMKEEEEKRANKEKRPAAKIKKKVSEFFAKHADRDKDTDGEEDAVDGAASNSHDSPKPTPLVKVKEKVKERVKEKPPLFNREPGRFSGIFNRRSKEKTPSTLSIPEKAEEEDSESESRKSSVADVTPNSERIEFVAGSRTGGEDSAVEDDAVSHQAVESCASADLAEASLCIATPVLGPLATCDDVDVANADAPENAFDKTPTLPRKAPPPRPPPPSWKPRPLS